MTLLAGKDKTFEALDFMSSFDIQKTRDLLSVI